jgi:D-alanyl-lipoteichoic acid acyltransferase DltB (MBOAT superfamily)
MLFNSIHFLIFFPFALLGYFLLPFKARNFWLLLTSYYFYAAWKPEYALLLLATTTFDFALAKAIQNSIAAPKRKLFFIFSLLANLSVLIYFKYLFFFAEISGFVSSDSSFLSHQFLLPLGISFYTFQSISYITDVYRKKIPAEKNFITYALFVVFFPQLVAGPIERAGHLISQLQSKHAFDFSRINSGLRRMAWGMFKKVVVADRLALLVDPVFNHPEQFDACVIGFAAIAFTFQILADFSGYTDIAIGAARCFGINLMENFLSPFVANSFTDFWRRWHISLSTWLRDYVYHPLGGNQKGRLWSMVFIMITFFLSGLWHGAALTFVIFGCIHGFFLALEVYFPALKVPPNKSWNIIFQARTYFLFALSLILFRAPSLELAATLYNRLFSFAGGISFIDLHIPKSELLLMPILVFVMEFIDRHKTRIRDLANSKLPVGVRLIGYSVFLFSILFLGVFENRQFIYFQF